MHWRRTEPLQSVGGFIAVGLAAKDHLVDTIAGKSALFRALPFEYGDHWAAVFAAPAGDAPDSVLPYVPNAVPLYEAAKGWWLPIGVELDAPIRAHQALWSSLLDIRGVAPSAIVVPRLGDGDAPTSEADVFLVRNPEPFGKSAPTAAGPDRR